MKKGNRDKGVTGTLVRVGSSEGGGGKRLGGKKWRQKSLTSIAIKRHGKFKIIRRASLTNVTLLCNVLLRQLA